MERRLSVAKKAAVPSAPATRLVQKGGLEATIEQKICNESLALILKHKPEARSILIVDLAGTGRAPVVWLAQALRFLAERTPAVEVTLVLCGTRWAGRGQLLARHLDAAAEQSKVPTHLICGPASAERSDPQGDELLTVRNTYDLIMSISLSGSAGLDSPWPLHPAQGWLSLSDAAVFGFIDPDSIMTEVRHYSLVDPNPVVLRVETLDGDKPSLVGQVTADDLDEARKTLPHLIETARRHPWRIVVKPPIGKRGTSLAYTSETAACSLLAPLKPRRSLVAGRLRIVAGHKPT